VVILNLCGNGSRKGYHATQDSPGTPMFSDPAL
jgi:hypothetical protein